MRIAATILAALTLLTAASPASPALAEVTPRRADPTIASLTEAAALAEVGWLELELTYQLAFDELNVQVGRMLGSYTAADWLELRVGWDLFAVVQKTAFGRDTGVGDPRFEGKFRVALPRDARRQDLALLAGLQPGIGQPPLSVVGADIYGRALYSIWFSPLRLDVNGGVIVNTEGHPSSLAMPFGARVWYQATSAVGVWGELVESLRFDDLSGSQTSLGAGVSFALDDGVALDASAGLGLTTGLPDGFIQLGATFLATSFGRD